MFRFGIVGAGIIGEEHKEALLLNPECQITAVCDIEIEKAAKLAEGTSARIYKDYKEMQQNEELDAVILNLPHFLHMEVTVYFLEHKIPVLCEKPMANTVAECDTMIETAKRTATPLAIGHVQRYFAGYREVKRIIESGELGKLCSFTELRNIDYFTNRPKWFLSKKQAGGGILMNYGAHALDKLFYTTGLKVEKVMSILSNKLTDDDVEASAQVILQLTGNVSASLTYCGCHVLSQYENYFFFTEGAARLSGGQGVWVSKNKGPYEKVELSCPATPISCQLAEFIKFLKGEENEMVTPEYAREVISVLEKAFS